MTEASIITMHICEDFVALRREVDNGDMGSNAMGCDRECRRVYTAAVGRGTGKSELRNDVIIIRLSVTNEGTYRRVGLSFNKHRVYAWLPIKV